MFNLGRLSRSPTRHQPRDPLENDERPLPEGWNRAISRNVDPDRVYYYNGRNSQWDFPNQEGIAERRARIVAEQAEADILVRIQLSQAGNNLREILRIITINNYFNERNMDVLRTLTIMILEHNQQPIDRSSITIYIQDLYTLIRILRSSDIHYNLKYLCEKIFEEMHEKLAKEKQMIEFGHTSHNERDIAHLMYNLNNHLDSLYIRFRNVINNRSIPLLPDTRP